MGLIHLYSATSTSFDGNGTPLVTAREAVVKRDEGFQLTFSIPISQNDLHKQVQKEMIVSAMTPDGVNYFRIWDIEKRTTDVKVTALQLLYSLDVKKVNPFGGKQHTGDSVLQAFANSFKSSISPYTFSSSIITKRDFYTNEKDDTSTSHNALAILNKITDTWSGELMLNGFDVRMISKLGTKTDALLYEHKNIASFSDSSSMSGIVTRIYATATYTPERAEGAKEDPEPVVLTATVDSPLINQYAVIYEATMEYNDARTVAELRTEILKQYSEFNVDKPERTIDVDTNIVDGTAINFGDELVLKYLVHDVDEVIRCVGYEYDPISENYIGVTLGTLEKTFLNKVTEGISSSVSSQIDKINNQIQGIATAANGRNRIAYGPSPVPNPIEGDLWFYHPEGRPDEVELLVYQNGLWIPAPFLTDQDRADFDQAMTDHYDAALAEIERKDQEYKEIFDAYDEQVATIDKGISDAATKAQNALEAAGISTDLAQTAKDLATTAQTNASTAITNANQAKADASTAVTNANQAKADAQTAITNASTALENANVAKADAQTAVSDASQAVIDANTAKTNAQTAINNASTAITNAAQAKTDASKAVTDASQAVADAQTAITQSGQAISSANTAKTNAQTAIDDAKSALTTAGNADSKAGQAIAKANAIPTTITDIIADKNLVNGSYVDTKVDAATGAWSQELVKVEGKLDGLEVGGRNLFAIDKVAVHSKLEKSENKLTYLNSYSNGTSIKIGSILEVGKEYTISFKVKLLSGSANSPGISGSIRFYDPLGEAPVKQFGGNGEEDISETFVLDSISESYAIFFYGSSTGVYEFKDIKIEKGNMATDWTPAPEDMYSQEEFKIFNAQYTQDVNGMTGRLTTVENTKLDGSTFRTFKETEYQVTADKVSSTVTRVDTAEGKITTQGTAISQNATAIASKADKTVVDTLSGTVATHTTEISQNATAIASKASSTSVTALTGRVSTAETTISQHATSIASKASQTELDSVNGTVSGHTTTLSQHAKQIASKAESSLVNTIKGTVDTHTTEISQNATAIASKASSASVNMLTGRVDTAESNISQNATAITQRVTTTTYNSGMSSKENAVLKQSAAPTHANGKLWLDTSTTPNVLKRSNGSAWIKATPTTAGEVGAYSQSDGAGLAGRLTTAETNITQTSTAITSKADKSVVDTLSGTVSTHTTTLSQQATQIASKAEKSLVDTIKGTVDNHTTEIAQNATDIASKASSSSVNTLTGRVDTAESNISQNATAISQRVTTTTYNAGIASKENTVLKQTTAPSHLNGRLWLDTSVTPNVLKRSTGTAWVKATPTTPGEVGAYSQSDGAGLAGRLTTAETNITQTATAITSKADKSVVDTLAGTVDTHTTEIAQNATAIASKASTSSVNTLTGRVSTAETTISQHATSIASKASQTEVDSISGTVSSHTSTLSQHASQISARLTSSQVNSLVDGKGFSTVNYVDSQITASASGIRADMTKVEGKIDGLQVGGRNLLSDSGKTVSNGSYNIARYDLTDIIKENEEVTLTIWGSLAATKSHFSAYNSGGSVGVATLTDNGDGTYSRTFKWKIGSSNNTYLNVYAFTNAQTGTSTINKIKLEKGNVTTDWSPAPEDTMMESDFNIFKASYEATAQSLTSRITAVDKVGGRLSTAETKITQNATAIASKASQTEVDTVKGTVSGHTTTLSQHATQIASKAESSLVNTIKGTVDTHTTEISQNATAIASKASTSSVNTLTGRVSTAESNISQNATAISARLTSSQVNSLVDGKGFATQTWASNQITATANGINTELTKINQTALVNLIENGSLTENTVGWGVSGSSVFGTHNSFGVNFTPGSAGDRIFYTSSKFTFTAGMTYEINFYIHRRVNSGYVNVGQVGSSNNVRVAVGTETDSDPWKSITYTADASNSFSIFFEDTEAYRVGLIFVSLSRGATKDWTQAKISIETDAISQTLTEVKGVTDDMLPPNLVLRGNEQIDTMIDFDGLYGRRVGHSALKNALRVSHGETYAFSQIIADINSPVDNYMRWAWVDANLNLLDRTASDNTGVVVSAPVGARYLRFSYNTSNKVKVEKGSVPTAWIPNQQDSTDIVRFTELQQDLDGFKLTAQNTYETKTKVAQVELKADRLIGQVGADGEKIAQMVMTDSLFNTKVLDVAVTNDTNLLVRKDERERNIINSVGDYNLESGPSYVNHAGLMYAIRVNGLAQVSFSQIIADDSDDNYFRYAFLNNGATTLLLREADRRSKFTVDVPSGAFFLRVSYNKNNRPKVQAGGTVTPYAPAPEDAVNQSEVTQLSNSWALTLKSGNDIKTQINATTNSIRLASKLIHLSGTSLIDDAVIKSAMVDTLNVSKLTGTAAEFTTLRGKVITAGSITADRLVTGTALVDRVFVDTAAITRLTSKSAFITNIKAIEIDVAKITGNIASFFQTSWQGLNSNVIVDSSKLRLTNSAKDFIEMNGIPELRSQDSAGTAAIMGKGRSHYYSGSQARFYIGSNLEGLAQYGIHIAKGQTFGIYRNSDTYGGTPAQYHVVVSGESWRSITTKYWNSSTSVNVLMQLNGYNVNNYPVLQPGDTVLIKAAVPGNSSGVETLWSMGTSSSGVTRLYSHPEHVFAYRIEVQDRARFIAKALFENSFTNNSDRRIKHDIKDTEVTALDHLDSLTFKEYKLNSTGQKVPLGLIAQDSGILRVKGEDEGDYEGIDGLLMPMLAMKGVQELHAIVKAQAEKIKQLEEIINR